MLSELLEVLLLAWAGWILLNFLALTMSALMTGPKEPRFNGFKIVIPDWMHRVFTPAEIAAVIAHEEGHRAHWDVWENFARVCICRRAHQNGAESNRLRSTTTQGQLAMVSLEPPP